MRNLKEPSTTPCSPLRSIVEPPVFGSSKTLPKSVSPDCPACFTGLTHTSRLGIIRLTKENIGHCRVLMITDLSFTPGKCQLYLLIDMISVSIRCMTVEHMGGMIFQIFSIGSSRGKNVPALFIVCNSWDHFAYVQRLKELTPKCRGNVFENNVLHFTGAYIEFFSRIVKTLKTKTL